MQGGTAFYAALTAQRLGYCPGIVTAAAELPALPPGIALAAAPSATSSIFAHSYVAGQREQLVHSVAAPIGLAQIPEAWRGAPLIHLGPVLGELDAAMAFAFPRALLGVTPQGWLRRLDAPPPAPMVLTPWHPTGELLRRIDLLVLSIEDLGGDEAAAIAYARHCPCVALTRGGAGLTLFVAGEAQEIPAAPARAVDSNGAGDLFAAAMLLQLFETGDPLAAARFGAAAAACGVEGRGAAALPSRGAVFARMRAR